MSTILGYPEHLPAEKLSKAEITAKVEKALKIYQRRSAKTFFKEKLLQLFFRGLFRTDRIGKRNSR